MADAEVVVSGSVGCAEAGAAEGGLDADAVVHQVVEHSDAVQLIHNGLGGGIDIEREGSQTSVRLPGNSVHGTDILKGACGAACDGGLVHLNLSVYNLGLQIQVDILIVFKDLLGLLFHHS